MKTFLRGAGRHDRFVSPLIKVPAGFHFQRTDLLTILKNNHTFLTWVKKEISQKKHSSYVIDDWGILKRKTKKERSFATFNENNNIFGKKKHKEGTPYDARDSSKRYEQKHEQKSEQKSEHKNEHKNEYKNERLNKKFYYFDNMKHKNFPYASSFILLSIISVSAFFQYRIYNLKSFDTQESMLSEIDQLVNYLDRYFIIYNYNTNNNINNNTNVKMKYENKSIVNNGPDGPDGPEVNNNISFNRFEDPIIPFSIFNKKYITSPFFTNENFVQSSVQLFTFFLASSFLEKYWGPVKYLALFLTGGAISNLLTCSFFQYIKKIEPMNYIDFILIHPTGPMAFICALCSIVFRNYTIWKNVPISCSICIVPYLLSSFYGIVSLYKINKGIIKDNYNHSNSQNQSHNQSSIFNSKTNGTNVSTDQSSNQNNTKETENEVLNHINGSFFQFQFQEQEQEKDKEKEKENRENRENEEKLIRDKKEDKNEEYVKMKMDKKIETDRKIEIVKKMDIDRKMEMEKKGVVEMMKEEELSPKISLNDINDSDNICEQNNMERKMSLINNSTENSDVLNLLKYFLIINACDSVIDKRKKEGLFPNRKISNLKKESMEKLEEIKKKSNKIFFELSSSFTDLFGIVLASTTFFLLKLLKLKR